ncbi:TetR-like C-terminal domain-containing protein [Psychromicrobium xiongbiense]|uniref:TetR-like C-terminal domain-containing protein n=1 Tax=Psychromicrobium xiongbiense TaxID=3051184 RepID=UPI00255346FE|nr:TetR/AcrR family transcriptional regulator [Psychromicrobium sp. YIM S02556]
MARPRIYDDELRRRLLDTAAATVAAGGTDALNLRTMAQECETSTSAIYALFGSKPAVLAAVAQHSADSFATSQHAHAPAESGVADLRALGLAYRQWALDHPALFQLMFHPTFFAGLESPQLEDRSNDSIEPLRRAVRRAIAGGEIRFSDEQAAVLAMWGILHGMVTLEMGGIEPPAMQLSEKDWLGAFHAALAGWTTAPLF